MLFGNYGREKCGGVLGENKGIKISNYLLQYDVRLIDNIALSVDLSNIKEEVDIIIKNTT